MALGNRSGPLLTGLALVVLVGCTGGDLGVAIQSGDESGDFGGEQGAVTVASAPWLSLDLATGSVTALAAVSDIESDTWRDGHMLFRRIDDGVGGDYLIAVFELTQAQWQRIGGTATWTGLSADFVGGEAVGADRPAHALGHDTIRDQLASWNAAHDAGLALPSAEQWTRACAGGDSGSYAWGDAVDRSTVAANALVWETADGELGHRPVGQGAANGFGLYDVHGNVWEWCSDERLRGGSWHDPVAQARTANSIGLADAGITGLSDHLLFGARLVLRP